MKKPEMIFFDFGGTLISEDFDSFKGTKKVLEVAVRNPHNVTCTQVQNFANELLSEIWGEGGMLEVHNFAFERYLYEYFNVEFDLPPEEIEQIFIKGSTDSKATDYIEELLMFLSEKNIRTGVISNISFSGNALESWINRLLPFHNFEMILASSEYVFRKPNKRLFEVALKKAGLHPEDTWYCGNSYKHDIFGATQAGLHPVWYKGAQWTDDKEVKCCEHTEVKDWLSLIEILS